LSSVSTAEDWCSGFGFAKGGVDGVLEGEESILGFLLRGQIAGDGDIDYAAGGDIGWEED
jgi:hypothetical protein